MKLPIIQNIVYGSLYPDLCIVERPVNGKTTAVPYTPSEIWDFCNKSNIIPLYYDDEDENGFPTTKMLEHPEEEMNYPMLANAFSKLPSKLCDLENLCIKNLSSYVSFDFESEKPVNISVVAPSSYTPIPEYYYPVDFQLFNYIPQHPFAKFYLNIIHAEMERIKLALLDYANNAQSDIATKNEVENTLSLMLNYATEITGKTGAFRVFHIAELHETNLSEINQRTHDFNIFPLLQQYLVKTYTEIEILFQPLLKRNIEQDFDDVVYKCIKQYPPALLKHRLQAAILVQKAQLYIATNNINALSFYHPDFVRIYPSNTDNQPFLEVLKAVENAIYLGDNTDIRQLSEDNWCKTKYHEKRKALEREMLALDNPRKVQSLLEDELEQLDLLSADSISLNSIPRHLYTWISDQLETTKHNLGNTYQPVSNETPTQNTEEPSLPSSEEFAVNVLEEKYKTFVSEVEKYRFANLEKVKCLDKAQQSKLIHLIVENPAAYAVVMLIHIGYFELMKREYGMNKTKMFQHVAKAIGSDERSVKGYFNVLDPKLNEDKATYNSDFYVEPVKKDYDSLTHK